MDSTARRVSVMCFFFTIRRCGRVASRAMAPDLESARSWRRTRRRSVSLRHSTGRWASTTAGTGRVITHTKV